ncbi:inositol monophosphatase [bacterium]|nr:inositol monophosphatase [bacterium]MBU4561527.1 inositol monophosphatase [bacterium]MCG2676740.1 inositol monophosphatase [bacterium]
MKEFRELAIRAAKEAGDILRKNLGKIKRIDYKGRVSLVTDIDRLAEERVLSIIREKYPSHDILTEESRIKEKGNQYKWIIDPLDGTTNYVHEYPRYCVSIALEKDGEVILGVVYDPVPNELFLAEKEKGATLNGKRISVSKIDELDKGLLATGFPYDRRERADEYLKLYREFMLNSQGIRRDGAAALNLCYTANGRFDGFWEEQLAPWDVAAGSLIVTEAGGEVTDFKGDKIDIYEKEILASNGKIHREMEEIIKKSP